VIRIGTSGGAGAVSEPVRVLVAGAGVGGLETVLALQDVAADRVRITLLAPDRHFTYRPLAVAEPFVPGSVQRFPIAAIANDRGVSLHRDALARVHTDERCVETQEGARLDYDALVLALGARPAEAVPGALTFCGPQDAARVREVVSALREGLIRRVAFVVPSGTTWALPLYELALQAAAAVHKTAPAAALTLVTPEPTPLAAFGAKAGAAIAELLAERGIHVRTGALADEVHDGRLWMGLEGSLPVDRVIALPRLVGPRPRGVPCDPLGFVPVDQYTRVTGRDGVYAVGDVAAHGVKQGGLAAQQADVAAAVIAAGAGAPVEPRPYEPLLRGLLLTGGETRYLRRARGQAAEVARELLWWPPGKIVGRHLAPYLAARLELGQPADAGAVRAQG
jgi:sulfide:quinone oxidoreductase